MTDLVTMYDSDLWLSSFNGDNSAVEFIIEYGINVNSKDKYGNTSLHMASWNGHVQVVSLLLKYNTDINSKNYNNETPLHHASDEGNYLAVQVLISHGADVNAKDKYGNTPLFGASYRGHTETVKILLNSPEIKLKGYENINGVKETLIKRKINMINKLKIIQIGCVGIEILEFIGGYLYPDISVGERLDIINKI